MTESFPLQSARGPLALERLSELPDGRLAFRMKRPSASGATTLEFAPLDFLRRMAALVPPPRVNLVRFFGLLAPNARLRRHVVPVPPAAPSQEESPPLAPGLVPLGALFQRAPAPVAPSRVPWAELLRRTFGEDVLRCEGCGGRRRVVAVVFSSTVTAEILTHLGLPARPLPAAPARDPPQAELYA